MSQETMMLPRALLADDHPAMLKRVANLLASTCEIVEQVGDGKALVEAVVRLHPDIVVIDICLPVINGIEAALQLKNSGIEAKLVFLTIHEEPEYIQAALATGASAYVVKSRLATDLVCAVQAALADLCFISPSLSSNN